MAPPPHAALGNTAGRALTSTVQRSSSTIRYSPRSLPSCSHHLTTSSPLSDQPSKPNPPVSSSAPPPTGSSKLFQDAALEESPDDDATPIHSMFQPDPTDVPWTGNERLQDTVLRMVLDKYKPLRIAADGEDVVERKLKGVQTLTSPGPPVVTLSSSTTIDGGSGAIEGEGDSHDGRRLPKTLDMKPWRAVYVRPSHLGGTGTPNIYYGQYLQSSSISMAGVAASNSTREKFKKAGVNVSQLPLDDAKAIRQIREGVRKMERVDKINKARERVLDYKLGNRAAVLEGQEAETKEKDQLLAMGGGTRGWASVVEERIRAAQDAGVFKSNKLRGKPIQRDIQERNPFLNSEEFFMNRIVKRQGAAPPWVELNVELEDETAKFRYRLVEQWCRRAVRMVVSGPSRQGLKVLDYSAATAAPSTSAVATVSPFGRERETAPPLYSYIPPARTEGEQRTLDVATSYRDPEWLQRERSYHDHKIKRLDELVRRHNHLAPFHARKGLMSLDREIAGLYDRARPELVRRLSAALKDQGAKGTSAGQSQANDSERAATRNIWGRIVGGGDSAQAREAEGRGGWWGNSVSDSGGGREPAAAYGGEGEGEGPDGRRRGRTGPSLGLLVALRKTIDWAKERVGV